jgi:tRNA A-37 threonylcarbamoyl transferase component Bud32
LNFQEVEVKRSSVHSEEVGLSALKLAGYREFDDFWNEPHEFVDDVNYRRNGWSAVSVLNVMDVEGVEHRFFLKRQESQQRYSLGHPFGALTYQFEVEAIALMDSVGIPCVNVVTSGFRKEGGKSQGFVLTKAIDGESLKDFSDTNPDWDSVRPQLQALANALFDMHSASWRHGALYPVHIFMNWPTAQITFIDLERARKSRSPALAAEADFIQFLKRSDELPDSTLQTLLAPYRKTFPALITILKKRFPKRQLNP